MTAPGYALKSRRSRGHRRPTVVYRGATLAEQAFNGTVDAASNGTETEAIDMPRTNAPGYEAEALIPTGSLTISAGVSDNAAPGRSRTRPQAKR